MLDFRHARIADLPVRNPFSAETLPMIVKLRQIGFHQYQSKWAKRLGKRPARLLFDLANHLKISGTGTVSVFYPEGPRQFDFDGRDILFIPLYLNHYVNGYEPELTVLLDALLTGEKVFYDIGSNWGIISIFASTVPDYLGEIHSFEPTPKTFDIQATICRQLAIDGRITAHQIALSDRSGNGVLNTNFDNLGLAHLVTDMSPGIGPGIESVKTSTIDDLAIAQPDIIKLDVENHELEVLQGAANTLTSRAPMILMENWYDKQSPSSSNQPLIYLDSKGYKNYCLLWYVTRSDGSFIVNAYDQWRYPDKKLLLVPFHVEDRHLLTDQINIFSCHQDRLDELGNQFQIFDCSETQILGE